LCRRRHNHELAHALIPLVDQQPVLSYAEEELVDRLAREIEAPVHAVLGPDTELVQDEEIAAERELDTV
jgi:hypothetical protein